MRTLDETDREILRLLLQDARRPYSDIAERVDLSAPAVSDRVDRLRELGVIEGFTLDLDRSRISTGTEVLIRLGVPPAEVAAAGEALTADDRVDHVFETAEGTVVAVATVDEGAVRELLAETVGLEAVSSLEVSLVTASSWEPTLGDPELAVDCVECGNTVTSEGETATLDGTRYYFCCGTCRANFETRYERLEAGSS
ncbi:AsnC family transcriptional regulator [Haloparvum alkalitolerans]|uniref:winged helix-turn-helix transcriptional regulator n=1 Tax=Haloparvum alkalitolerans TaxID=1042953 RepID=UPI003CED8681